MKIHKFIFFAAAAALFLAGVFWFSGRSLASPGVTSISATSSFQGQTISPVNVTGTNFGLGWDKENGLAANWRLDEASSSATTTIDASGNNNNGTSSLATVISGKINNGRSFTGSSNSYVDISNASSLQITGNITVNAWANFTASQINAPIVAKWGIGNHGYILMVSYLNNNRLMFVASVGGVNKVAESTSTYNDGAWHMVTGVFDGAHVLLYIDGSLVTTGDATTGPIDNSTANVGIAKYSDGSANFGGSVDEVRIYNRALSAAEVSSLYSATTDPSVYLQKNGQANITMTGEVLTTSTSLTSGTLAVPSNAGGGAWNVVVLNPDNTSGTLSNAFTLPTLIRRTILGHGVTR